ncbi:hypothetical protein F5X98DRAFT_388409 [Xylaria grammica]|nr:hypothetical protein F5X98DRAFT_388409 [Xylaria grammica]
MKRQQSFHNMPPKRHCPSPQVTLGSREHQYQVSPWSSNGGQLQGHLPQQPVEQSYYHSNNISNNIINNGINSSTNNSINHNINAFLPNNSFYGFMGGSAPMQHTPIQHTPVQHTPVQYTPIQYPPVQYPPVQYTPQQYTPQQFTPHQFTPAQLESVTMTPYIEFGNGGINNNTMSSCIPNIQNNSFETNYTTQNQHGVSQFCPVPQPPSRPGTEQRLWEPQQTFRCAANMPGTSANVNTTHSTHTGGNIPNKVPIELPECYAPGPCILAVRGERPESQDADGFDLTAIGRREPAAKSKEQPKTGPIMKEEQRQPPQSHKPKNPQKPVEEKRRKTTSCQTAPEPGSSQSGSGDNPPQSDSKDSPPKSDSENNLPRPGPKNNPSSPNLTDNLPQSDLTYAHLGKLGIVAKWLDEQKLYKALMEEERKEKEREEEEQRIRALQQLGNISEYGANCCFHLPRLAPGSRILAIYVGSPRPEWIRAQGAADAGKRWEVHAMRRPRSNGVEYKLVESGASVEQMMESPTFRFSDIQLDTNFARMKKQTVAEWVLYLLDAMTEKAGSGTKSAST